MNTYQGLAYGPYQAYGHLPHSGLAQNSVYSETQVQLKEAHAHLDRLIGGYYIGTSAIGYPAGFSPPRAPLLTSSQQADVHAAGYRSAHQLQEHSVSAYHHQQLAGPVDCHSASATSLTHQQYQQLQAEYAEQVKGDRQTHWNTSTAQLATNSAYPALRAPFQQTLQHAWQESTPAAQQHLWASRQQLGQQNFLRKDMLSHSLRNDAHSSWDHYAQELTYGDALTSTRSDEGAVTLKASQFDAHDHPSFAKPPHLNSAGSKAFSTETTQPQQAEIQSQTKNIYCPHLEEPQLIAEDTSAIPPPPPIEKSAFPLAALATDLVWEAFLAAANSNKATSPSSISANSCDRGSPARNRFEAGDSPTNQLRANFHSSASPITPSFHRTFNKSISPYVKGHSRSRSLSASREIHQTSGGSTNSFGAIGGERRSRPNEGSPDSEMSSPASSVPGTPSLEGPVGWMISTNDSAGCAGTGMNRLAGLGCWGEEDSLYGKEGFTLPTNTIMRASPLQQQIFYATSSPAPPVTLFEQVQKLLAATLLSQQVLLLALYYVAKLPHTSPLYPPATSQSALQSTSAPFKLLLAALVVANKVCLNISKEY